MTYPSMEASKEDFQTDAQIAAAKQNGEVLQCFLKGLAANGKARAIG